MDNQNDGSPRAGVYPGAGRSQISRHHATQAAQVGDEVVIIGHQGDQVITVEDVMRPGLLTRRF